MRALGLILIAVFASGCSSNSEQEATPTDDLEGATAPVSCYTSLGDKVLANDGSTNVERRGTACFNVPTFDSSGGASYTFNLAMSVQPIGSASVPSLIAALYTVPVTLEVWKDGVLIKQTKVAAFQSKPGQISFDWKANAPGKYMIRGGIVGLGEMPGNFILTSKTVAKPVVTTPTVAPVASVSPTSGAVGTTFTETCKQASPSSQTRFYFKYPDGKIDSAIVLVTNTAGTATNTYTYKSGAQIGSYQFWCEDIKTGKKSNAVTYKFL